MQLQQLLRIDRCDIDRCRSLLRDLRVVDSRDLPSLLTVSVSWFFTISRSNTSFSLIRFIVGALTGRFFSADFVASSGLKSMKRARCTGNALSSVNSCIRPQTWLGVLNIASAKSFCAEGSMPDNCAICWRAVDAHAFASTRCRLWSHNSITPFVLFDTLKNKFVLSDAFLDDIQKLIVVRAGCGSNVFGTLVLIVSREFCIWNEADVVGWAWPNHLQ